MLDPRAEWRRTDVKQARRAEGLYRWDLQEELWCTNSFAY